MSRLLIRSVSSKVEYRESENPHTGEKCDKRFEGTITLEFVSSGDLEGYTKEQIAGIIGVTLINDYISL